MKAFLKSTSVTFVLTASVLAQAAGGGANLPLPPPVATNAKQTPQVRCVKAFTSHGYTVGEDLIQACRQISGPIAADAIELVTGKSAELNMMTVNSIVRISTSLGFEALKAFVQAGYGLNEDLVDNCSRVSNMWSLRAIQTLTSSNAEMSVASVSSLLMINGRHSLKCIRSLSNAGYGIGSNTDVIETCARFNSDAADAALEALTSSNAEISVSTLQEISRM